MRVYGRIEDAYTEKLLPGALITLRVGDTELIEHTPARGGQFAYDIPDAAIPIDEDILTCIVEKKGYKTQITTYTIREGDIELAVELVPDMINWKRVLTITGIGLGALLLLGLIGLGVNYFFFGPTEDPIKSFTITPEKIRKGEKAEIAWKTNGKGTVYIDEQEVDPDGTQTVTPEKTRQYKLVVKSADGTPVSLAKAQITVVPPPPTILSFTADPLEINLWETTRLEWKTTGAETIYIFSSPETRNIRVDEKTVRRDRAIVVEDYPGSAGGGDPADDEEDKPGELGGRAEAFPLETTTFTLVAVNKDGIKREETVEVTVLAPPEILRFSTSGGRVDPGQSVVLSWDTREAEQVFLNGERTGPRYSVEVRPDETTTYKLTARNKIGERHCTVTVHVNCPDVDPPPPQPVRIHRFHITAPEIARGESTRLSWSVDNARRIYLKIKPHSGDFPVGPEEEAEYRRIAQLPPRPHETRVPVEIIAGKPLETGRIKRVKAVDSLMVSPIEDTYYELRAVTEFKEISWTRLVKVKPGPCVVILYELEHYKGQSITFTTDSPYIGKLNNRVSSIKILGNCRVKVYSAQGFHATHQEFHKNVPSLRGTWIGDNSISSLQILLPGEEP